MLNHTQPHNNDEKDESQANDERHTVWVSQPTVNSIDIYQQPPPTINGTHSEALTDLQTGYLHAISALEARNKALQQDLAIARAAQGYQNVQGNTGAAQHIANLEERNTLLQRDLDIARQVPHATKQDIHHLNATLAAKNQKIKEKNNEALQKDDTIRKLRKELGELKEKRAGPAPSNEYVASLQKQLQRTNDTINVKSNQVLHCIQENNRLKSELAEEKRKGRMTGTSATQGLASANRFSGNGGGAWTNSSPYVDVPKNKKRFEAAQNMPSTAGRTQNDGTWTGNSSYAPFADAPYKKRKFEAAPGSQDNPLEL